MKIKFVRSRALACTFALAGAWTLGSQAQIVTYSFDSDNSAAIGFGVSGGTSVAGGNFVTASGLTPASGSPTIGGGLASAGGWKLAGTENASTAQADGNYFEFSLSRGTGDIWQLGDLTFDVVGSAGTGVAAGPNSVAVFLSTTSASSGFSQLGSTLSGIRGATGNFSSSLNAFDASESLFFRIIAFSGAGNNGTLSIDQVDIGGTAFPGAPVPEPEHYAAFAGLALIGFGAWRRVAGKKA